MACPHGAEPTQALYSTGQFLRSSTSVGILKLGGAWPAKAAAASAASGPRLRHASSKANSRPSGWAICRWGFSSHPRGHPSGKGSQNTAVSSATWQAPRQPLRCQGGAASWSRLQ